MSHLLKHPQIATFLQPGSSANILIDIFLSCKKKNMLKIYMKMVIFSLGVSCLGVKIVVGLRT